MNHTTATDDNDALVWAVSTGANELILDVDSAVLFTRFWRHWVSIFGLPQSAENSSEWQEFNKATYAAFYAALLLNKLPSIKGL